MEIVQLAPSHAEPRTDPQAGDRENGHVQLSSPMLTQIIKQN